MNKSVVTKATKFDKVDNYGNWSYLIEFKNGDRGYYSTKSLDQNKFVAGSESEYEIEQKIGKNDKIWFKITSPSDKTGFKPSGGKPGVDPKTQMIGFTAAYVKDLIVADKIKLEDFENQFNRIYSFLITKIV